MRHTYLADCCPKTAGKTKFYATYLLASHCCASSCTSTCQSCSSFRMLSSCTLHMPISLQCTYFWIINVPSRPISARSTITSWETKSCFQKTHHATTASHRLSCLARRPSARTCAHSFIASSPFKKKAPNGGDTMSAVFAETLRLRANRGETRAAPRMTTEDIAKDHTEAFNPSTTACRTQFSCTSTAWRKREEGVGCVPTANGAKAA
jgi:hypothetical protein